MQTSNWPPTLRLLVGRRYIKLPIEEIKCLDGEGNYTRIVTGQRAYLYAVTMSQLALRLKVDPLLVRVHKRHMVNLRYVAALASGPVVILDDDTQVPISRRQYTAVKAAWTTFKEHRLLDHFLL